MSRSRIALVLSVSATLLLTACGGDDGGGSSAAAGCTPEHTFDTVSKGTLTVGVYDLPPYAMTTGDDGMSGVDADIVREFAKRECLKLTAQPGNTAALIPSVQQGRSDLALGDWYRTAERAKVVNLSDPLYVDQMGIISKQGVSAISDLEGKTVGTVDGYLWVADLQALLGDKLRLYPSAVNMNQDLAAGRIDIGVDSYGSALQTQKDTGMKVEVAQSDPRVAASQEPAQAGFPMSKNNQEMLDAMNQVIADLHKNGRIAEILQSYGLPSSAAETGDPRLI
jgi:polar amino acid transport system substrate-binding protein